MANVLRHSQRPTPAAGATETIAARYEGGVSRVRTMPVPPTVVIPVWDSYVDRFLRKALDSVLSQDLPGRIVVVDNCSQPPVGDLPGIHVVRSPKRLTVGAARNLGLEAVESPAVLFWDADDEMLPGTLRCLHDRLDASSDAVAVSASILEKPSVGHHWPRPVAGLLSRRPKLFAFANTLSSQFPTTGSVLMRTGSVRDAGGFGDFDGGDDWALGVSLAFRGRVVFERHPGRIYHQHADSLSSGWTRADHVAHVREVRRRVRRDHRIPRPLRYAARALAPLQLSVIFLIGPVARALRPFRSGSAWRRSRT